MKGNDIFNSITSGIKGGMFKVKAHSPEILLGLGVAGVVTSTVLACKATMKLDDILTETKDTAQKVNDAADGKLDIGNAEYTEDDRKHDLFIVHVQTAVKIVKLYTPSVVVGLISIGAICQSHNIQAKRYAELGTAYTVLSQGFKEYRSRVVDRYGADVDQDIRFGHHEETITETTVDPKTGEETATEKTVAVDSPLDASNIYIRFFDAGDEGYNYENRELTMNYLWAQQCFLNRILHDDHHLVLNDAFRQLKKHLDSKAGMIVGWTTEENLPGDHVVDFGIFDADGRPDVRNKNVREFMNGDVDALRLEFNVDGVIYGKFEDLNPVRIG